MSENWWSNSLENQEENSFDFESVEEDDQVLINSQKLEDTKDGPKQDKP